MKTPNDFKNRSREEFMAYVMSYAARLDINHSAEERAFIKNHTVLTNYESIHEEIKKDSDMEALEKIESYAEHHEFTLLDRDLILVEVRKMFEFNDENSAMEEGILAMLRKIFQ
jgi:hypothetical protein